MSKKTVQQSRKKYSDKFNAEALKRAYHLGAAEAASWDNAYAENFFSSLKVELLYGEPLMSRD